MSRILQPWGPARLLARAAAILWLLAALPAQAAPGLFSIDTLSGVADLRLVASDGERSWTDGGFGKGRFGGSEDLDWKVRPVAAEATLAWQPRFSWSVAGTVVVAAQHEQDNPVDLVEAFLTVKPLPTGATRISGRAGLYWPQVSLEHEGPAWSVADMITPSAINSWIGEEVKVIGAEASVARAIGSGQLSAGIGLFGFNDTSGTLLAFRGWALHDKKATAFGLEPLPPLNAFMIRPQAPQTRPLIEIDTRPGFYGRVALRMAAPVALDAFYYDNRGDPEAVSSAQQWGWRTRFWNVGARIDPTPDLKILAQVVSGTTEMGIESVQGYWVETRFRSAYLRLSQHIGAVTASARYELFDTRERGTRMERAESEKGSAATAALSWKASERIELIGEAIRIDSERGVRARVALPARQKQLIVQAALRLSF